MLDKTIPLEFRITNDKYENESFEIFEKCFPGLNRKNKRQNIKRLMEMLHSTL